jgi:hypothetical protein
MMTPFDPTRLPPQPLAAGEDDLIELTEVVEEEEPLELTDEAAAEVVLDLRGGSADLASLKAPEEPVQEPLPAPQAAPREESLDDFLASLPELPEDLDISPEPRPVKAVKAPAALEVPQRLSDDELKELVRQAVQETVERLARELLPPMASEAIDRELVLLKKRLTEPD